MRLAPVYPAVMVAFLVGSCDPIGAAVVDDVWNAKYADHLPAFCKYTQQLPDKTWGDYGNPLSTQTYAAIYGSAWSHMHHFCFGLEAMYQASISDSDELRRSDYGHAVTEFDYVLERSAPDMAARPDLLFNRAIALLNIDQRIDAVKDLTEVIALDPKYVPAYLALSDYFRNLGDTDEAVRLLRDGLAQVPDSEVLKTRLAALQHDTAPSPAEDSGSR